MSVSSRDSSGSRSRRRRPRIPSWVLNPDDPFKSDPLSIIKPKASRRLSTSDDITGFFGNRRSRGRSLSNLRPQTAVGTPSTSSPLRNSKDFSRGQLERIPASPYASATSASTESRGRQMEKSSLAASTAVVQATKEERRPRRPLTMGNILGDGKRSEQKKSFVGLENHPIPSTPFDPFGDALDAPFPDMRGSRTKDSTKITTKTKRKRVTSFLGQFSPFSRSNLLDVDNIGRSSSTQTAKALDSNVSSATKHPSRNSGNTTSLNFFISRPSAIRDAEITARPESGSIRVQGNTGHNDKTYEVPTERRTGVIGRIRNAVKKST